RRRVNLDEHLVALRRRLPHLADPNHSRRAVPGVDRCLHAWTVATASDFEPSALSRTARRIARGLAIYGVAAALRIILPAALRSGPMRRHPGSRGWWGRRLFRLRSALGGGRHR